MKKRLASIFLVLPMLVPGFLLAQTANRPVATNAQPAAPASPPVQNTTRPRENNARPQSASQRRSYERETRGRRRHSGISKKEVAFMAAIAGTSMGIGAIAAGGEGLAIGAIVGGWGAYAGHRIWGWVR